MNDINFFEPYLLQEDQQGVKSYVIPIILILAIFIGLFVYYNSLANQRDNLMTDIYETNQKINDSEKVQAYEEALEAKNNFEMIKEDHNMILQISNEIENNFNVNRQLINVLLDEVPMNTYFKSIDFNKEMIKINCITDQYNSSAQFIYNLKTSDIDLINVFVPSIQENDGDYEYEIILTLGGEDTNESK